MAKNKLNFSNFKIELVPLVSDLKLEEYFDESKFRINNLKIVPYITNPTNDDFRELFAESAKLASAAESKINLNLTPVDKQKGLNASTIKDVFEKNKGRQIIDLKMSVQNKNDDTEKPIVVSNTPSKGKDDETDVSVQFVFDKPIDNGTIIGQVIKKLEEQKLLDLNKVKEAVVKRFKAAIGN